jgi:hypothetical protein
MYDGTRRKFITLICAKCNDPFEKEIREFNRQIRKGRTKNNFYCSYSCHGDKRRMEDAPFNYMLRQTRKVSVAKKREFNLTLDFLKELWNTQKGLCTYTGVSMKLLLAGGHAVPFSASLDRISSAIGYIQGNVEFVCLFVNLGKSKFSKDSIIELLTKAGVDQRKIIESSRVE